MSGRLARRGLALALLFGLAFARTEAAEGQVIAALKSRDLAPYAEAIEGLRGELPGAELHVFELDGDVATAPERLTEMMAKQPDLLLAVGTLALRALAPRAKVPVVFMMVGRPEGHFDPAQGRVLGVSLDPDPAARFRELRALVPSAQRIGVLFNEKYSRAEVDEATAAVAELGLELIPVSVDSPKEVPEALRSFDSTLDALWLLPNKTALNARSLEYVVVEMTKRGVPILGESLRYTKAGALLSLDAGYGAVGVQTGDLVRRLQAGAVEAPLVERPRNLDLTLNLKAAGLLGLKVPGEVVARAAVTVE